MSYKLFLTKIWGLNFLTRDMVKKLPYSKLKIVDDILTRVKINIPQTYGKIVDRESLYLLGIKEDIPIYIANKNEIEYVSMAMQYTKFYCIIFEFCENINGEYVKVLNKNMIPLKVLNTIYLLNINYGKTMKLHLKTSKDGILINNNDNLTENFDGKILYLNYYQKNIEVEIKRYYNNGDYYNIKLKNKSDKIKNTLVEIINELDLNSTNYYLYKENKRMLNVFDLSGKLKQFVKSDKDVKFGVSRIKEYKYSNWPIITIVKNIKLQPKQIYEYNLVVSKNDCGNLSFKQSMVNYLANLEQRFKIKIKSTNTYIDKLINNILPQNIIFDEIRHLKGPEIELKGLQSFEQLLEIYKNKKISNKQMYKYMLEDYIGFKETATMYFFKPKTNFDFVLFVEGREIEVKHLCDKKFIEIDGVKYYNICCVSKNSFLLSSKILLVI